MLNPLKHNRHSNPQRIAHLLTAAILAAASLSTSPIHAQDAPASVPAAREPAAPPARNRDPGGLMDHAAQSGAQVFVDDSFASVEKLREAMRYASQGQAQLAITSLQKIINDYGQKLVFLNDNSYVSITDYVREKLLQLPAVKQGMYDQLYGGEAKKAIDTAVAHHDLAALIHACDRYYPSSAALAGLSQAAEWYFERGEFASAARTWKELLIHPMAATLQPELLFRAATAESLSHNAPAAKLLRDRLQKDFPTATATLQGQEAKLLARLDEILAMPPWDSVDLSRDEWPAFEGGPDRSKLMNVNAIIGARLWGVPFGDDTPASDSPISTSVNPQVRQLQQARMQATGIDVSSPMLNSFSVLSNGTLFVHTGDRILALSANAGTLLWSYPQQVIPRVDAATEIRLRNALGTSVRPNGHDSVSVVGDQVFAVLPAPINPRTGRQTDMLGNPVSNSRVVCLNRNDASELWSCSTDDVKLDTPGALTFIGSPTVTRQGVFIMARKVADAAFVQQYLIRLDRETGAVTWACYLCSTSNGAMYSNQYVGIGAISVPTIVDDVVYICTGQGADCAVDANAGRILWLHTADTGSANRAVGEFYNPTLVYVPAWKFNPPVIAGDKMIACDNTQMLRIYDRWAGKLLTTIDTSTMELPKVDVVAGVVGPHLIIAGGRRTLSINLDSVDMSLPTNDSLKPEWVAEVGSDTAGNPQGRPFLTTQYYYAPFDHKLVRITLDTGKSELWDWPKTEKDADGKPGNLLVTSEQVIVVNDTEIAGYSKWETARDNRLAKITASPADPEPYLALAEISFRTNHQDLAQENMKKSVDLANSGDNTQHRTADILTRLYQTNLNFAEQLLQKSDAELRDQARFYYEQCRGSARTAEQQAQWRLRLAELSIKQKKIDEAATLYSEVLADSALRSAGYHENDMIASAGSSAEQKLHKLIIDNGAPVYRRFEDQAAGLLQKAQGSRDPAALQQIIDSYPNSASALTAATALATLYRDKSDWENARKVLWWLEPRAQGEAQATAIANLASVSIGLKKYPSAAAWAARGARQYKDLAITSAFGEKLTFADIRKNIVALGVPGAEGRLPLWNGTSDKEPEMSSTPLDSANVLAGSLLVPIETASSLRQSNYFFLLHGDSISVYDSATGKRNGDPIHLPQVAPAVLLGATADTAIFLQPQSVVGLNLKTHETWNAPLPAVAAVTPVAEDVIRGQPNQIIRVNAGNGVNQIMVVNGVEVVVGPNGTLMLDANGNPIQQDAGDPELVRRTAFAVLPRARFTTARILDNRVILVAGNRLSALDIATGRPAWHDRSGSEVVQTLPTGQVTAIAGNEDVVAVQVDNSGSSFFVVDADTGKLRKQLKLPSEQASWRAVGDDGTLFVVTDQSVSSYDLVGEQNHPLWRRSDIQTRFASATALTLDGLIVVDNSCNVMCLSLESGEMRWPGLITLTKDSAPRSAASALRSTIEGDRVIFQYAQGIVAVRTYPSDEGQIAWVGTIPAVTPSLQGLQLSDPYLIEFASGPVPNSQHAVKFIFRSAIGGKLDHAEALIKNKPSPDGPQIRAWQVLDTGIAFDVGGEVYFWRNKPKP